MHTRPVTLGGKLHRILNVCQACFVNFFNFLPKLGKKGELFSSMFSLLYSFISIIYKLNFQLTISDFY